MLIKRKQEVREQVKIVTMVAKEHSLRLIDQAIDFNFIYDQVTDF